MDHVQYGPLHYYLDTVERYSRWKVYCSGVVRGVVDGVGGVAVSVLVSFVDRWCKLDSGRPSQVRAAASRKSKLPDGTWSALPWNSHSTARYCSTIVLLSVAGEKKHLRNLQAEDQA